MLIESTLGALLWSQGISSTCDLGPMVEVEQAESVLVMPEALTRPVCPSGCILVLDSGEQRECIHGTWITVPRAPEGS